MNTILVLLKRHPLAVFVLLSYLLSWLAVVPTGGLLLPWGPMLAALIVVGFTEGRAGLKALWSRVVQRGAGLRWVGLAVAIPVTFTLAAAAINILLGAPLPEHIDWSIPLRVLPVMLLVSGMWEEPGWTGYALPHLLKRFATAPHGLLVATLITAGIRAGWHLPLMLYGHIYWSDLIFTFAFQIVLTWLFKGSRHSVWVVMLCHLANNTISGEFVQYFFSGADWTRFYWLFAILWSLLAVGVLGLAQRQLRRGLQPTAKGAKPIEAG